MRKPYRGAAIRDRPFRFMLVVRMSTGGLLLLMLSVALPVPLYGQEDYQPG